MIFASAIFLTGLLAIGVPIAIHLLARQRTRILAWGAMDFLRQSAASATARRKRLRDLLLLLLRVLAIACVVLAFAQPLVPFLLGKAQQQETVFIWDLSLSTAALNEDGKPIHEVLKARLIEELDRLPDRSNVRILLAGAEARWLKPRALTLSSANRQALKQAVRGQDVETGDSQLANAILLALALEEEEADAARFRELVVLHDYQRRAWQAGEAEHWAVIRRQLARDPGQALRTLDTKSRAAGNKAQVAVTHLAVDRDTVAPEAPVRMRATLRNTSAEVTAEGDVTWRVNGREVDRISALALDPASELKLEQVLRFETTGCHQVTCRFELNDDALPLDNGATCVVSAVEALPILVIDDTERIQPGQIRPSEFVVAALGGTLPGKSAKPVKPEDRPQPGAVSLFAPKVIRSTDFKAEALAGTRAVFLVAADHLREDGIAALHQFAQDGGGTWLVMDTAEEQPAPWCISLLNTFGLSPFVASEQRLAADQPSFVLKVSDPKSPFAVSTVAHRLDLHRAEVQAVRALKNPLVLPEEQLLETASGIPVLLSLPVGAGRLLLQTTDLRRLNTNLPILQSFVPLVRELAWQTAGPLLPQRNLAPGEVLHSVEASTELALGAPVLILPDGRTRQLPLRDGRCRTSDTRLPGVYKLYDSQRGGAETAQELYAVQRPAEESELDALSDETIAALVAAEDSLVDEAGSPAKGKWPLAFWFALAAAGLFLAEALLAQSIARKRAQLTSRIDLKPIF